MDIAQDLVQPTHEFTELTLKKMERLIQLLALGYSITESCKLTQLSRPTFYAWRNHSEENKKLAFEAMTDNRVVEAEDALYRHAMDGNPTLLIFFLCNRAPERWKRHDNNQITNIVANVNGKEKGAFNGADKQFQEQMRERLRTLYGHRE